MVSLFFFKKRFTAPSSLMKRKKKSLKYFDRIYLRRSYKLEHIRKCVHNEIHIFFISKSQAVCTKKTPLTGVELDNKPKRYNTDMLTKRA